MRTMIDILKKGNQELFHSSIIAWLLDPNAEHNLHRQFFDRFAQKLANIKNGTSVLKNTTNINSINTEMKSKKEKGRYDIELNLDNIKVIIENKTKSIGGKHDLDRYKKSDIKIALGLCDMSFSEDVYHNYPVLTYKDILDILNNLTINPTNDYHILIKHYQQYLERELRLFDVIDDCFGSANINNHNMIGKLFDRVLYHRNDNDSRFIQLFF